MLQNTAGPLSIFIQWAHLGTCFIVEDDLKEAVKRNNNLMNDTSNPERLQSSQFSNTQIFVAHCQYIAGVNVEWLLNEVEMISYMTKF